MPKYTMDAAKGQDVDDIIYDTQPAAPETAIVYAFKDGARHKVDVVAWGILGDGTAVPITISGVWDGSENRNVFVQHPSGRCGAYDESWENADLAAKDVAEREP
jgi:hypothetical protein